MNVACRPWSIATFLTMKRNVETRSAVVIASAYLKSISCWPAATSWCAASTSNPICSRARTMSRRASSPRSTGRQVEVRALVVRVDDRVAVRVAAEQEELGLGTGDHRVAEGRRLVHLLLQGHAGAAGEGRSVGVVDVADQPADLFAVAVRPRIDGEGVRGPARGSCRTLRCA